MFDPQFQSTILDAAIDPNPSERVVAYALAYMVAESMDATVVLIGGYRNPLTRSFTLRYRHHTIGVQVEPRGDVADLTVCRVGEDARIVKDVARLSIPTMVKSCADDMIAVAQEMAVI